MVLFQYFWRRPCSCFSWASCVHLHDLCGNLTLLQTDLKCEHTRKNTASLTFTFSQYLSAEHIYTSRFSPVFLFISVTFRLLSISFISGGFLINLWYKSKLHLCLPSGSGCKPVVGSCWNVAAQWKRTCSLCRYLILSLCIHNESTLQRITH